MSTHVIYHPDIHLHDQEADHVAMARNRIAKIAEAVVSVPATISVIANLATVEQLYLNHSREYVDELMRCAPADEGIQYAIDEETMLNRHTMRAMLLSAGAACQGVDDVLAGRAVNAFCPVYPGHHAESARAAGFCFVNSVAIAAKHALRQGVKRLAILDIDTHSGNGTVLSVMGDSRILFAETYQDGYPGEFIKGMVPPNILRRKIRAPYQFRESWDYLLTKVKSFSPELILVSAGFDAHMADPLGQVQLLDIDYIDIAQKILTVSPHVVAVLEGGYDVEATARCASLFVKEMAHACGSY